MKQPLNESREKMAFMPQGSQILYNPITKAAGFRIKNVFVMAGIPEIMIAMFKNIIKKIKHGTPEISKTILINSSETIIARDLFKIQNEIWKRGLKEFDPRFLSAFFFDTVSLCLEF